ncbi:MAG: hypothetical protein ABSF53_09290 [Terracidiphilus sp.]
MTTYAESIPVRHLEGTLHGFVELRSEDGKVLATGDLVQVAHGARVTSHMLFRFTDGSVDDETTVFSQRRSFQLIADRHVQKGPFFPHPMDLSINSRTSEVTVRTAGKDGKEEVITEHVKLPSDLANGIVPLIIKNIPPDTKETRVSIVVATPKPRIVQLAISPRGEEPFSLVGFPRSAMHYEIQIELGGVAGIVAPLVGKAPPKLQAWIVGGEAPVLVREDGPIYQDGPTLSIELASPTWPNLPRSGD